MATYTNSGLVKHCKDALKLKTKYMWGGLFREIIKSYVHYLSSVYPKQYPTERVIELNALIGKGYYGCDCVGLIKSYYFGGVGSRKNAKGYDGNKDVGVGGMYQNARVKGKIDTMIKAPGILVMTSDFGHVGVYIGDNKVIECTLSKFGDGVVQTNFSDRQWAYWCQCPFIEDDTSESSTETVQPTQPAQTTQSTLYSPVKSIYHSIGVAAMRDKPTLGGTTVSKRCVKGDYYLADRLYAADANGQKWFKHTDREKYSALTDTNGEALFDFCGTYVEAKSNAVVNIRETPSLGGSKVARLVSNVPVYTTEKTTLADNITWLQVVCEGKLCWCDKRWITIGR